MRTTFNRAVTALGFAAIVTHATPAHAQFGGFGRQFAASGGVVLPIGELDKSANAGFEVMLGTESGSSSDPWTYGGTFSYTRLTGRDTVRNYQFFGFGGNLKHNSTTRFYQFIGFSISNAKRVMSETSTNPFLGSDTRSEQDFGLSGGVGVTFGTGRSTGFVEFGVANIFGDQTDYRWFPVRVGVRF